MQLGKLTTIIFDLDGTLYEDQHHFAYYARQLSQMLPSASRDAFIRDYRAASQGRHPVQIGRVYDTGKDLVLVQIDNNLQEVYAWNGQTLPVDEHYSGPVAIDQARYISIGDPWWIPQSIARHYGLSPVDCTRAFLQTREYMISPAFEMNPVPGFRETLLELKTNLNLVLLTNSPQADSAIILQKLGLDDVFDHMIFDGKKPRHTRRHFEEIRATFDTEIVNMLSVGDNYVNEIIPAWELGMPALFIDCHHTGHSRSADMVVGSIAELIPVFRGLLKHRNGNR